MRHYLNKTHETEHTKPRALAHTHTHIETHIVQQWTRAREMCARQFMISGSAHAFDEVHVCMFSQTFSTTNAGRFHYNPEYPAPHPLPSPLPSGPSPPKRELGMCAPNYLFTYFIRPPTICFSVDACTRFQFHPVRTERAHYQRNI